MNNLTVSLIETGDEISVSSALTGGTGFIDLIDFDISDLSDGCVIVYDEARQVFVATTDIDNQNTKIIGGSF
jgi:hypothetical protein